MAEPLLDALASELAAQYGCHTVILYGSRATGAHRPDSDYDLLLVRASGGPTRDARTWQGLQVDAFIYPEDATDLDPEREPGLLRIRHGRLLIDKQGFGARLLRRVQEVFTRGPKALPPEEVATIRVWGRKMLERAAKRDMDPVIADYRRASLLAELLPLYFQLRMLWYFGPQESLRWLAAHDPLTHTAFAEALDSRAPLTAIERLVQRVIHEAHGTPQI
jgi:uncharacterized protein